MPGVLPYPSGSSLPDLQDGGNAEERCVMPYGIHPLTPLIGETGTFVWRFDTLVEASNAARSLSQEHHAEVMVFQIIGIYKPEIVWKDSHAS